MVAAELPERAKFVAFESVNRWVAVFKPVDVDFSSTKVNLVPAEVCGLTDAQGVGIDDRDEPLVAEAVLRGLSGGFLKQSDFRCSEIFPSANVGVVRLRWREGPSNFLLSCQDGRIRSVVT